MTRPADREPHEGHIEMVHDARGYTLGHTITCSCGWNSPEVRDGDDGSKPQARVLLDHWQHLLTVYETQEATT